MLQTLSFFPPFKMVKEQFRQTCNFFPAEKQEGQSYQQYWELIKPGPSLPLNIVNTYSPLNSAAESPTNPFSFTGHPSFHCLPKKKS